MCRVIARLAVVLVALVTTLGTLRPWSASEEASPHVIAQHPAWTSGTSAQVGAALAVAGLLVLLAVVLPPGRRPAGAVIGALLTAAGVVVLLADWYGRRPFFYVSVGGSEPAFRDIPVFGSRHLPDAAHLLVVGALGALAVAAVVARTPADDGRVRAGGRAVVLGLIGVAAVVVGSVAFPWRVSPAFETQPLWRADVEVVVGAALVVLAGLVLLVARRSRGGTGFALLAAAAGFGLVLPARLPVPWGDRTFGVSSYQPLEALARDLPSRWWFDAATALVLIGGALVLLAALAAATSRQRVVPAANSGRSWA